MPKIRRERERGVSFMSDQTGQDLVATAVKGPTTNLLLPSLTALLGHPLGLLLGVKVIACIDVLLIGRVAVRGFVLRLQR
jgi:hypothetical protein